LALDPFRLADILPQHRKPAAHGWIRPITGEKGKLGYAVQRQEVSRSVQKMIGSGLYSWV